MLNKSFRFSWERDVYVLTIYIVSKCNSNHPLQLGYFILYLYEKISSVLPVLYLLSHPGPSGKKTPKQCEQMEKTKSKYSW